MANTTWNPADLSNVTLSGSNLIATAGSGSGGVRGIASQISGKYYWEYTYTTINTNSINPGIALASGSLTGAGSGLAILGRINGDIIVNGSSSLALGTIILNGNVIGIAVDFTAQLLWFRIAPSGNWNGSGTANPATGVVGASLSALSGALYPYMTGGTGDKITANFGATAFSGAVPAGFTAGFTASPPPTTVFLTSGTTWTVPSDWNNAANTIECIGGGGGGYNATTNVGTGGEGGHYAKSQNITLTPLATINIAIGTGGAHGNPPISGGNTWFGGTTLATSNCGAVGGAHATNTASNATTATTNDVGNIVVRAGGFGGGFGGNNSGSSAGGGAAGPGGVGGGGGLQGAGAGGGGGGAGNTGGAGTVGAIGVGTTGGNGGASGSGTAGGAGGANTIAGGGGSNGSGGGGGGQSANGGAGGAGVEATWDASHGPGGGGGGSGTGTLTAGAGGLYGGGGGGGGFSTGIGGNGAQGIIVVTYTSSGGGGGASAQARAMVLA